MAKKGSKLGYSYQVRNDGMAEFSAYDLTHKEVTLLANLCETIKTVSVTTKKRKRSK